MAHLTKPTRSDETTSDMYINHSKHENYAKYNKYSEHNYDYSNHVRAVSSVKYLKYNNCSKNKDLSAEQHLEHQSKTTETRFRQLFFTVAK